MKVKASGWKIPSVFSKNRWAIIAVAGHAGLCYRLDAFIRPGARPEGDGAHRTRLYSDRQGLAL